MITGDAYDVDVEVDPGVPADAFAELLSWVHGRLVAGSDGATIVHCAAGMRSARACGILKASGFEHVRNMKGGILAWSDRVDPSVPKY